MSKMSVVVRKVPESGILALGRRTFNRIDEKIDVLEDEVKDAEQAIQRGYLEESPKGSS